MVEVCPVLAYFIFNVRAWRRADALSLSASEIATMHVRLSLGVDRMLVALYVVCVCVWCFDCVLQSPVWLLSSTHIHEVLIPHELYYTCAAGLELFMSQYFRLRKCLLPCMWTLILALFQLQVFSFSPLAKQLSVQTERLIKICCDQERKGEYLKRLKYSQTSGEESTQATSYK